MTKKLTRLTIIVYLIIVFIATIVGLWAVGKLPTTDVLEKWNYSISALCIILGIFVVIPTIAYMERAVALSLVMGGVLVCGGILDIVLRAAHINPNLSIYIATPILVLLLRVVFEIRARIAKKKGESH